MSAAAVAACGIMVGNAEATSVVTLDWQGYVGGSIKTNLGNRNAGLMRWSQSAGDAVSVNLTDVTKKSGGGTITGFLAFCIEPLESLHNGGNEFAVLEPEQAPNKPAPMGAIRAENMGKLFEVGFLGTSEDDWKVNGSFDMNYIKAFQLAVWEVVNEAVVNGMQTLNILKGDTADRGGFYSNYSDSHAIASLSQSLLDQAMASDTSANLIAFGAPFEDVTRRSQDQITLSSTPPAPPMVPTPAAAAAGLLGLAGLAGRRGR
ncbi:hypothetical protein [Mucisphaera calidilacus]|nr:hypothetical protein [Mucisphaera calidilacus]